jgi:hypothetical protein
MRAELPLGVRARLDGREDPLCTLAKLEDGERDECVDCAANGSKSRGGSVPIVDGADGIKV